MVNQLVQGLGAAAVQVGAFIPRLLAFLVVLLIGYVIAKIVEVAVRGGLHRTGFNRLVERGGMRRALRRTKYDASELLARIVFYAVMLFVLQFAFGVFGPNAVSAVLTGIIAYLPRVFAAGLIVVIGAAIAAVVRDLIEASIGGLSYGRAVANVGAGTVLYVTTFAALDELNIAPAIVTGLFYASLAAIVGTLVVAAGGGGIPVMRTWWERLSGRLEAEAPMIAQESQGASERVRARTAQRTQQAQEMGEETQRPTEAGGQQRTEPERPAGPSREPRGTQPRESRR